MSEYATAGALLALLQGSKGGGPREEALRYALWSYLADAGNKDAQAFHQAWPDGSVLITGNMGAVIKGIRGGGFMPREIGPIKPPRPDPAPGGLCGICPYRDKTG